MTVSENEIAFSSDTSTCWLNSIEWMIKNPHSTAVMGTSQPVLVKDARLLWIRTDRNALKITKCRRIAAKSAIGASP